MAVIPAGSFEMGKTVDRGYGKIDGPTHTVRIEQPFELAVHEVTLGEFRAFVEDTGHDSRGKCNVYEQGTNWFIDARRNWSDPGFPQQENHPVVCVSWRDAQAYIDWLNDKTGQQYRLPSEAEWEYTATRADLGKAARRGETSEGASITHDIANIGKLECCGGKVQGKDRWLHTAPVGSFPADQFGLRDLRGNVWEWQADCYHPTYEDAPVDGSARSSCPDSDGEFHVVRGGSYGDAGEFLSERFRLRGPVDQGYFTVGFRLARSPGAASSPAAASGARAPTASASAGLPATSSSAGASTRAPTAASAAAAALFDAIRQRDVAALGQVLSRSVEPEIVYYWGDTVAGRDAILQWHREWFAETGWVLAPAQSGRALSDERLANLTYTVEYIKNPERKFLILMTCTLVREPAGWKLARIQQTLLEGPE